ncbi:MAG: glycosyltransferase family 2 protein [Roseiflexaceae bacterium]
MSFKENPMPKNDSIRLSALVPVYNEQETLVAIVEKLEQISIVDQIIIVDDASIDGTRPIIESLAAAGRVDAYYHEQNRGKGAALRTAVMMAKQPYLVIQDADLEYDPNDFYAMAEAVQRYQAMVVYGSRFMGGSRTGMLWTHYLGNRVLTMIFNLLFWQRLTDMETCYKLFRTDLIQQIGIDHDRFDVDPELTAKIIRAGHRIYEVPIAYQGRTYLAGKKIKPRDAITAVQTLWRYRRWKAPAAARSRKPAPIHS